jgi:hypothetical protein
MKQKIICKKSIIITLIIISAVSAFYAILHRPTFNADKVAIAETQMWRAYYSGNKNKLGLLLISLLRSQYGLSFPAAKEIGESFASSAIKFHSATGNYEQVALPDLINAYTLLKKSTNTSFDPDKTAKAELAWWVARRTKGENSVEQVGTKIGELYALIYGNDNPAFKKAGILRAQAAALRDSGRENADWAKIENILKNSYHKLENGI